MESKTEICVTIKDLPQDAGKLGRYLIDVFVQCACVCVLRRPQNKLLAEVKTRCTLHLCATAFNPAQQIFLFF